MRTPIRWLLFAALAVALAACTVTTSGDESSSDSGSTGDSGDTGSSTTDACSTSGFSSVTEDEALTEAVQPGGSCSYVVETLPEGTYEISLTGMTDDADLEVFDSSDLSSGERICMSSNSGSTDDSCQAESDDFDLYITVASFSGASTDFTLEVSHVSGGNVNVGTQSAPEDVIFTSSGGYQIVNATVGADGTSYYKVTNLGTIVTYDVSLDSWSGDVTLSVYGEGFPFSEPPANAYCPEIAHTDSASSTCEDVPPYTEFDDEDDASIYFKLEDDSGFGSTVELRISENAP